MNSLGSNGEQIDTSGWVYAIEGKNLFASDQKDIGYSYWAEGYSDFDAREESDTTQAMFKYRPDLKGWVLYGFGGTCVYKWEVDENGQRYYHEWGHGPVYADGTEADFLWVDRKCWTFKTPSQDTFDETPQYVDLVSLQEAKSKFPNAFPLKFVENSRPQRAIKFWTSFFGFNPSY